MITKQLLVTGVTNVNWSSFAPNSGTAPDALNDAFGSPNDALYLDAQSAAGATTHTGTVELTAFTDSYQVIDHVYVRARFKYLYNTTTWEYNWKGSSGVGWQGVDSGVGGTAPTSFGNHDQQYDTDPDTAAAWESSGLTAPQFRVVGTNNTNQPNTQMSQAWVGVTYQPVVGGLMFHLWPGIRSSISLAALSLSMMPAMSRQAHVYHPDSLILPSGYEQLYRELRAYRFPTVIDLGR
jgi:hypothetical protein